jgi:hypothetical protein
VLFAWLVMPAALRAVHAGTAPAVVASLIGSTGRFIDDELDRWHRIATGGLVMWALGGAVYLAVSSRAFATRVVGTATPGTLGAVRMVVCLVMIAMAHGEKVRSVVPKTPADRGPMGVMSLFFAVPGFDQLMDSGAGLAALKALVMALLLAGAVGFKTRWVLPIAAALYLPLAGIVRSYTWFTHNGIVAYYALVALCFTRCGDGWSVDRVLRLWRGQPVVPADVRRACYAWGRWAVWLAIALTYLAAGLSKIRHGGPWWWHGTNIQAIIYASVFRPYDEDYTLILSLRWLPQAAFTVLGLMTLFIEAGFWLVLFSTLWRKILPVMALGMHLGIEVLQKIRFLDLMIFPVLFYDWRAARQWLGRRIAARRGRVEVHFDSANPVHQRALRLMRAFDLLERLEFHDRPVTGPGAAADVPSGWSLATLTVVTRGQPRHGTAALRAIAWSLPVLWPVAPVLALTGAGQVANVVHGWFATRPADAAPVEYGSTPVPPRRRPRFGPLGVSVATSVLLGAWVVGFEYYPITIMKMYSSYNDTGVITRFAVLKTDESGRETPAHLERLDPDVGRYHKTVWAAFGGPETHAEARELLVECGREWNSKAPPGERVAKLSIVQMEWDFVNDRDNPNYGKPVQRVDVTFPVGEPVTASAHTSPEPTTRPHF